MLADGLQPGQLGVQTVSEQRCPLDPAPEVGDIVTLEKREAGEYSPRLAGCLKKPNPLRCPQHAFGLRTFREAHRIFEVLQNEPAVPGRRILIGSVELREGEAGIPQYQAINLCLIRHAPSMSVAVIERTRRIFAIKIQFAVPN